MLKAGAVGSYGHELEGSLLEGQKGNGRARLRVMGRGKKQVQPHWMWVHRDLRLKDSGEDWERRIRDQSPWEINDQTV